MYCSNCGKKVVEGADFCTGCGKLLPKSSSNNNGVTGSKETKPGQGMAIASLVLGILGVLYCFQAFSNIDDGINLLFYYTEVAEKIGFIIGYILVQSIFGTLAICFSISSKKKQKSGFNTAGFWLSIAIFAMVFIQFVILGINA